MTGLRGPALIESRYGALGSGSRTVTIKGDVYSVSDLLVQMALNFDDSRAIDALTLPDGRYVFRYYDGQDQRIVAHEFDSDLRFVGEIRAHVAEWIGEDAYYKLFSGH